MLFRALISYDADCQVDTNNISAILRSAYFFGIAALALPTRSTAHPSSFSRASSGAIEAVPLLGIPDPKAFLDKSKREGFKVLCTALPSSKPRNKPSDALWQSVEHFRLPTDASELSKYVASNPTILILGGESAGIPRELEASADATVEIERTMDIDEAGIDSLNVSVAAGIILSAVSQRGAT
jgi:21S rRNA (GM2251-2'-O)-methyltransferase